MEIDIVLFITIQISALFWILGCATTAAKKKKKLTTRPTGLSTETCKPTGPVHESDQSGNTDSSKKSQNVEVLALPVMSELKAPEHEVKHEEVKEEPGVEEHMKRSELQPMIMKYPPTHEGVEVKKEDSKRNLWMKKSNIIKFDSARKKVEDHKVEAVKVEQTKLEPVRAEPVKVEHVKKLEPARADHVKVDHVKVEPVKVDHAKPEPVKVDHVKVEPVKVEPVKVDHVKPEPVKVEHVKPEPVKVEHVKVEPVKKESGKIEPTKEEQKKTEPVKMEPNRADPKKMEVKTDLEFATPPLIYNPHIDEDLHELAFQNGNKDLEKTKLIIAVITIPTELHFKAVLTNQTKLTIKSIHDKKVMFKIKLSDNVIFQVNPVFGVVDPGKTVDVVVTHSKSAAKEFKMVVLNSELTGDEKNVAGLFKALSAPTGGPVVVKMKAV